MPDRVVVLGGLRESYLAQLAKTYGLVRLDKGAKPEEARGIAAGAKGGGAPLDARLLAALPDLRFVANFGVGVDSIDLPACRARGVVITNTPGMTDGCVADQAMLLLLAQSRRAVAHDRFVREGKWPAGKPPLTRRVWGRKAGILGMGRIGLAIAKRCAAFDMEVGSHNRHPRPEAPYRYFPDLLAMAQWADVIIIATPGGAETRHLVDAKVLAALGKDGIIVNIARGTVIDEAALIAALRDGTIAGAGLDVFEREPEVPAELMRMENVVLAPHMAGSTNETWDDCESMASENLRRFFAGEKLLSPVA